MFSQSLGQRGIFGAKIPCLALLRIAGDGAAGTQPAERGCAPQKLSVQQDTAPPEPAPLHPQPEQSLAEVRAAPAPAQSPGRQLQLPGKQRARLGRKIKKEQFKALAVGRPKRPQTCVSPW